MLGRVAEDYFLVSISFPRRISGQYPQIHHNFFLSGPVTSPYIISLSQHEIVHNLYGSYNIDEGDKTGTPKL